MLQNLKPYKDHETFQLEQISNSKSALNTPCSLLYQSFICYIQKHSSHLWTRTDETVGDYSELKKKKMHFVLLNLCELSHFSSTKSPNQEILPWKDYLFHILNEHKNGIDLQGV